MHRAIINGNMAAVSTLLSDPSVDVNSTDKNKCTPHLAAVILNTPEIIRLLMKHNDIDVNQHYYLVTTVLHCAVRFGYTACVEELLQYPGIDTSIIIANLLSPMTHVFSQSSIAGIDALLHIGDRHTCSRDFFLEGHFALVAWCCCLT